MNTREILEHFLNYRQEIIKCSLNFYQGIIKEPAVITRFSVIISRELFEDCLSLLTGLPECVQKY